MAIADINIIVAGLKCSYPLSMQVPPCPMDYRVWQQTMYTHFGQKWSNLHHGPMWNVASCTQTFEQPTKRDEKEILEVKVIIAHQIPSKSACMMK